MVNLNLPKKRSMRSNAAVWKRIVSFIIDMIIVNIFIIGPFSSILQKTIPNNTDFMGTYNYLISSPETVSHLYLLFGAIFLLIYSYFVIFEYKLKQTPGKMIFKLYLAPIKKKENISLIKILLRNLALFPVFPFSLLWIIDPLYLIFTGKRLSDKITKTTYVEEISL